MSENLNADKSSREIGFIAKSVSLFSCAVSLAALILFVVSHGWRPDILMMATIFPVALWLVCGLFVSGWILCFKKFRLVLLVAWLLAAFVLGDAPVSMIRGLVPADGTWEAGHLATRNQATRNQATLNTGVATAAVDIEKLSRPVRVISINCSSSIKSVRECFDHTPDIILMQESPPKKALEDLVETELNGYSLVWSADASMLVNGTANSFPVPGNLEAEYVFASVELTGGGHLNVAGLRLIPSVLRFDVWNQSAWREFAENRCERRKQLADIEKEIAREGATAPTIIGGDFNAPAGDAIFELLRTTFRDAYVEAGRGWGKTIVNNYPAQRIDQVWITTEFKAESVIAKKTLNTDHRMVICDLWLMTK